MKATKVSGTSRRTSGTGPPSPIAAFWRKPTVCAVAGFSPATLERRVKARDFPQPVKLGPNTIAWSVAEVQKWVADRIAERDQVGT
jgi:prophage regulatory protein